MNSSLKILIAIVVISVAGIFVANRISKTRDQKTENISPAPTVELTKQVTISPTTKPMADIKELKIEDLVTGTGVAVKSGDTITMHYSGSLLDGTKFDNSYDRGKPFETQIGVGRVIKGWDEGVIGMKVGGKRRLTIPSELAYGQRGIPGAIPPNSPLIFELELISIK